MEYLKIIANTTDEYTEVTHFLTKLDNDLISLIKKGREFVKLMEDDYSFYYIKFYHEGIFVNDAETMFSGVDLMVTSLDDPGVAYETPDGRIDLIGVKFYKEGFIFNGFGKYTMEQYYTQLITFEQFFKVIKK